MVTALIALSASICWGMGDVIAGLAGRRTSSWTVSLVSQAAGLAVGLALFFVMGRRWPGWEAAAPALLSGVVVALGMGAYFKALAVGTMSLVAPIASSSAVVPVAVGLMRGERPSVIQAVGVFAAVIGVGLAVYDRHPQGGVVGAIEVGAAAPIPQEAAGRAPGSHRPAHQPRLAVVLAVVAAVFFGLSLVGYAATAAYDPFLPAVAGRATSVIMLTLLVGGLRLWARRTSATGVGAKVGAAASVDYSIPGFRLPKDVWPSVVAAGLFHLAAATLFSVSYTHLRA